VTTETPLEHIRNAPEVDERKWDAGLRGDDDVDVALGTGLAACNGAESIDD
jgi:hypothetical protein